MAKTRPLVDSYLERISVQAFDGFRKEITDLVKREHGVYALYKNNRLYYVGLAVDLRRRIRHHLKDRHANRWNRFSLYLVRKAEHIKELESLVIRIADPGGNTHSGKLRHARNLSRDLKRSMLARSRATIADIFEPPAKRSSQGKGTTPRSQATSRTRETPRAAQRALRRAHQGVRISRVRELFPGSGSRMRVYATLDGKTYRGVLYRDGRVRVGNQEYSSLSAAAAAIFGRPKNGWDFWHVHRGGKRVSLSKLRTKRGLR